MHVFTKFTYFFVLFCPFDSNQNLFFFAFSFCLMQHCCVYVCVCVTEHKKKTNKFVACQKKICNVRKVCKLNLRSKHRNKNKIRKNSVCFVFVGLFFFRFFVSFFTYQPTKTAFCFYFVPCKKKKIKKIKLF